MVRLDMESGERHRRSTITDEVVRQIRADREAGMSGKDGARKYGISAGTFCQIGSRKQRRLPEDDLA